MEDIYRTTNSTEDLLRINQGKKVELFLSFPNATDWKNKTINGIIESAGRDCLILSDPTDGSWYLLPLYYIDFIKFDEPVNNAT